MLYRDLIKQYDAYIILGDIVDSKSIPFNKLNARLETLFHKLRKAVEEWKYFNYCRICTYPLGDGFVTVIIFIDDDDEGVLKPNYARGILSLCYDYIIEFETEKNINIRIAAHQGTVDCFNFRYKSEPGNAKNEFEYYIGDSIASASRYLNFGDKNHLIISKELRERIETKNIGIKKYGFSCIYRKIPDKKNIYYEFYTVNDNGNKLNHSTPMLKDPKPIIEQNEIDRFKKKVESCPLFFSTSVTDAKSWLNDHALITVLFQQAVYPNNNLKQFKRVFIWDKDTQQTQYAYQNCLSSHHEIAGVRFQKMDYEEARSTLGFPFNSEVLPAEIIVDPIVEAWICCKNNCNLSIFECEGCETLECGYGNWDPDNERYDIVELKSGDKYLNDFKKVYVKLFDNIKDEK